MKKFQPQEIRNVAFIGHGSAGKTSIGEAILFLTGVSDRLGKVGDNSSQLDYDPDEIKRGHSINASVAFCEWNKNKINILDTPGSNNFIADTPACIRVADGALVVISAEDGIQYFTEKVWQWADESSLLKLVFINKIDSLKVSIDSILDGIKNKLKAQPVLLQIPYGNGENLSGVIDLAGKILYKYEDNGIGKKTDFPQDIADELELARETLIEAVAESNDELIEKYLESGELTEDEFSKGLINGIEEGKLIPVLCGSATSNIGIDLLLDGIIKYLPSPDKRVSISGDSLKDGSKLELEANDQSTFSSLIYKTVADTYAGKLSLFRIFSGVIKSDSSVFNANQETQERIGQLFALQGKKQTPVQEVSTGDIGTVAKLKSSVTGDSLTVKDIGIKFPSIDFPKPVLSRAMAPKTRADEEKISNALHRLSEEDPSLTIDRDPQTNELIVSGMGVVHLDVIVERMKSRFGVEVEMKPPKVPYLETIRGTTKVQGKHKKQSGGRGQFGDAWIEISPIEKGQGFIFENKIVGGAIPKGYIPAVEKGVQEAMLHGRLAGYPMVDIKVVLVDGSYHDVDSSEMAFKIAGSIAFKKGVLDCKPILLEPIMLLEVIVPSESVGDIIGDMNSKRGKILGVDAQDDTQSIRAHAPMASVLNYAPELRSMTGGRGNFIMEFAYYDDVPEHITQKIIEQSSIVKDPKE
ncbi:MAG: elongation factor G [Nitrospinales bacterium]